MKFSGKKIYLISTFVLLLSFFLSANFCFAEFLNTDVMGNIGKQADQVGGTGGYDSGDIFSLIQIVISVFLSIIGVLLLIYMLYAGYSWMTAQGDEEKVTKAKDTIQRAIIGAIIIIAAYAISIFVMGKLQKGTLQGGGGATAPAPASPVTPVTPVTPVIPIDVYVDPRGRPSI